MVDVSTIGAGGGSIAWIDKGGLLRVGPESAGAQPRPGVLRPRRAREPTVTDANLVLGRINAELLPRRRDCRSIVDAARQALERARRASSDMALEEVASADRRARRLQHGQRDPAGLDRPRSRPARVHARLLRRSRLAPRRRRSPRSSAIREVLVPIHQGVFSAFGLMTADMRVDESVTASLRSDHVEPRPHRRDRRPSPAASALAASGERGLQRRRRYSRRYVEMRYLGQNYSTDVAAGARRPGPDATTPTSSESYAHFHAEHRRLYGYDIPDEVIEFVNFKVAAVGLTEKPSVPELADRGSCSSRREDETCTSGSTAVGTTRPYSTAVPFPPERRLVGPAIVEEPMATTLLHPGRGARR